MINHFQQREAETYYSKCKALFSNKKSTLPPIHYTFVAETNPGYSYSSAPMHVNPSLLTGEVLQETLDMSFESSFLFPDNDTFYIMDLTDQKDTPYNSLMFQLNASPMKSKETTKEVMNRYFEHQQVPYSTITKLGEALGYKQRLPYVYGETFFVPDRGTSKQSASWYALHHVSHAVPQANELLLHTDQHLILTLPLKQAAFDKQVDRAAHLYYIQLKWYEEYIRHYNCIRLSSLEENIVHRRLKHTAYPYPEFTIYDFVDYLTHYRAQQALREILGEGNPHWDEVKKDFQLPPRGL